MSDAPPIRDLAALAPVTAGVIVCYLITGAGAGAPAAHALAALALGSVMSLALMRQPGVAERRAGRGLALVALLAAWYLASRWWGVSPGGSVLQAARFATFALVAWTMHVGARTPALRWMLLGLVAGASAAIALPTTWDVLRHGMTSERLPGAFGYWNATAIVALALVPLAAAMGRMPSRLAVIATGPVVAVATVTAAVTSSRGALAATAAGLVVLVVAGTHRRAWTIASVTAMAGLIGGLGLLALDRIPAWLSVGAAAVVTSAVMHWHARRAGSLLGDDATPRPRRMSVLGVVLVSVALFGGLVAVLASFQDAGQGDANAAITRLASADDSLRYGWWADAVRGWHAAPVIGRGGDAFQALSLGPSHSRPGHVHSLPLEILLEAGLLGFAVAAGATLVLLRAALGARRTPERAVALGIVTMILVQAAIDWTFSMPQVMGICAIALAVALPDAPSRGAVRGFAPAAGAALAMALLPFIATTFADEAARALDDGHPVAAALAAHRAMLFMPTLDTLQVEVAALDAAGRHGEAITVLESRQRVWYEQVEGLRFAAAYLDDDSALARRVAERLERHDRRSA